MNLREMKIKMGYSVIVPNFIGVDGLLAPGLGWLGGLP